jgi:hypothetical protein
LAGDLLFRLTVFLALFVAPRFVRGGFFAGNLLFVDLDSLVVDEVGVVETIEKPGVQRSLDEGPGVGVVSIVIRGRGTLVAMG